MEGNQQNSSATAPMSLSRAWLGYAMGWIALLGVWLLGAAFQWLTGYGGWAFLSLVCGYVVIGAVLSRKLLARLIEWHPVNATLANVSSTKLRMMLLWPITYPILFFQLTVDRHL
ncbi:hypothetical protein I5I61_03570 [Pseudomonas nitroreducens]|uniref:Uncharacterized protein n=1 Tax=Pseudomonas nitroreducens TaxID=46680 RepID=A0ABS0KEL7_PSENT|nr:hypothetical protein [Pseudomonas nitroreducens]MBG6286513.1 hypothetical protein [Pseudomonas nitroreducens]MDG9852622.1 hypothetical protein [Pseudomonas nitroreducens]